MRNVTIWPREKIVLPLFAVAWLFSLASCASYSRLYLSNLPAGSSHLAEVIDLAQKKDLEQGLIHDSLISAGIKESDLHDGSVAAGRVHCCGGPNEVESAVFFYVPPDQTVKVGDIVEVTSGRPPHDKEPGVVNILLRVRQHADPPGGPVQWAPETPGLWRKVLYADWMKTEGWIQQDGLFNYWYKPAAK